MKKIDVSRLERLRSANLKVGFAVSLFCTILAFSWTIERPPLPDFDENFVEIGDLEIIPATTHPEKKEMPPQPEKLPKNFEIIPDPNPPVAIDPGIITQPEPEPGPVVRVKKPTPEPDVSVVFEEKNEPGEIFKIVEEMPRFIGCEEENLSKDEKAKCAEMRLLSFLGSNLRYPSIARENGIEGTVVVQFIIETDGRIADAKVVRDIGAGCGEEALRVVKAMPDWIPGKQRGREVRVQFNLPVRFQLN